MIREEGNTIELIDLYWYVFIGGGALTLLAFLFGDFVEGILDGFFHPILIFGGVTIFGISGLALTSRTDFSSTLVLLFAVVIAVIAYIAMYFIIVLPMSRAESSIGLRLEDLKGMEADIITPIPKGGYGEITVTMTSGIKSLPAKSATGEPIERGTKIFISDIVDNEVLVLTMRDHHV